MSLIKIHSDGTALGTHVTIDGAEISRITKIELGPIVSGGIVTAKLTVLVDELQIAIANADIECDDPEFAKLIRAALLKESKL